MGPLTALTAIYHQKRAETLALPHLGVPSAQRGNTDPNSLPATDVQEDRFTKQTKEPIIIAVEYISNGTTQIYPVKGPCSHRIAYDLTQSLVKLGVHPLDIVVARWNAYTDDFTFRTSVDLLFWTLRDQARLDGQDTVAGG